MFPVPLLYDLLVVLLCHSSTKTSTALLWEPLRARGFEDVIQMKGLSHSKALFPS